ALIQPMMTAYERAATVFDCGYDAAVFDTGIKLAYAHMRLALADWLKHAPESWDIFDAWWNEHHWGDKQMEFLIDGKKYRCRTSWTLACALVRIYGEGA